MFRMFQYFFIIFISMSFLIPVMAETPVLFQCKVTSVHDGDTFTCTDNTKIRIWGINTPEVVPAVSENEAINGGGNKARDYLNSLIINKELKCSKKGKSWKRTVAQCFLNKEDIATIMLKKPYTTESKKYSKGYYSTK